MGPLAGIKLIELAGLGPAPFCAMLLADMGAEVLRIERPGGGGPLGPLGGQLLTRGRQSVSLDLKQPAAAAALLELLDGCDGLIEGFRPGVMERLGLGPEPCQARNPRLVYGRMTGWGQDGPLAQSAGHDINYIALSGALHAIGGADGPAIPLNLVGDFGGGGLLLAFGMVCALLEARGSGRGQVVDAAMTDGAALLMTMIYQLKGLGAWTGARGANLLDGGAHFYATYACADGRWLAVGALEPAFYAALLERAGISEPGLAGQWPPAEWPARKARLAEIFGARPRDEWCALFAGSDVCVTPVLDLDEAPAHPHNQARQAFVAHQGLLQPAPAPRFSRTPAELTEAPASLSDPAGRLAAWGLGAESVERLRAAGLLAPADG